MSFRVQLQPKNTHKLHVFVQLGLMIAKGYQGKTVLVLVDIQSRSKFQVVQTTRPEGLCSRIGLYLPLLKARLLGQVQYIYRLDVLLMNFIFPTMVKTLST